MPPEPLLGTTGASRAPRARPELVSQPQGQPAGVRVGQMAMEAEPTRS
jgi:hypothetical protein